MKNKNLSTTASASVLALCQTAVLVLAAMPCALLADGPLTINTSAAAIRADSSIGGYPNLFRPSDNISHRFYVSDTEINEGEEITVVSEFYGFENTSVAAGLGGSKIQPDFSFNAMPPPVSTAPGYPMLTAHGIQGANSSWVTAGGPLLYPMVTTMGLDQAKPTRIEVRMRPTAGNHTLIPGGWIFRRWNTFDWGVNQMQTAANMFWMNYAAANIRVNPPAPPVTRYSAMMTMCSGQAEFVVEAQRYAWNGCNTIPNFVITLHRTDGSGNITGNIGTFTLHSNNTVSVSTGTLSTTSVRTENMTISGQTRTHAYYPSSGTALWRVNLPANGNYVASWQEKIYWRSEVGGSCNPPSPTMYSAGAYEGRLVFANNCGSGNVLNIAPVPPEGGTATGTIGATTSQTHNNVAPGTVVALNATVNPGFVMERWGATNHLGNYADGYALSTNYTMGITGDNLTANFASFASPISENQTINMGASWSPTVDTGSVMYILNGPGAFIYRVYDGSNNPLTNWQPLSTTWSPPAYGSYIFRVGQLGTPPRQVGNTNDPVVGNLQTNNLPYTLTVNPTIEANVMTQLFDDNTPSVSVYAFPGYTPLPPAAIATNMRLERSIDGGSSWQLMHQEVNVYQAHLYFNTPYIVTTPGSHSWRFRSHISIDNGATWADSPEYTVNFTVSGAGALGATAVQAVSQPASGYEQWYVPSNEKATPPIDIER